jgi:hypothetical protein
MHSESKRDAGCAYIVLGVMILIGAGIFAYFLPQARLVLLCVCGGGVAMSLLGGLLMRRAARLAATFEPNEHDLEKRKRKAGKRAKSLEEHDAIQSEQVGREYRRYAKYMRKKSRRGEDQQEPPEENTPVVKKPWESVEPEKEQDDGSLVVTWWATPSLFLNGGTIQIALPDASPVTVEVPENAKPGILLALRQPPPGVIPFKVRVIPTRVHPDEQRLE